jgi:hypothetical protein
LGVLVAPEKMIEPRGTQRQSSDAPVQDSPIISIRPIVLCWLSRSSVDLIVRRAFTSVRAADHPGGAGKPDNLGGNMKRKEVALKTEILLKV